MLPLQPQTLALEAGRALDNIFGVLSEKQAYKVARNLLKEFALECIAEEATSQNLSPSIREKVQAKALREISKQTENFSTHWAEFSAKGLAKVTDLEAYVKRKLVAAGDFKDIRKRAKASFSQAATAVKDGDVPMLDAAENLVALCLPSKKEIGVLFPKAPQAEPRTIKIDRTN
jgi:hypothetical protein